ncbi:MAG TPA: flagellar biosynthesis protein FlhA [Kofleriaceae bacterium]
MKQLRWAELAIAALVIAVVAMLIVPVPRPLLDVLLALNIAASVALLMAAVFTPHPIGFVSFPTLLVITTLFRVGLEVSTTRLILADADAGSVVRAFGSAVVAENLVVGLVVFAVITLVQLIVVARGAERVAEVAARFALDAMPGKQMAIDAELRAGSIDPETARTRRTALERESQLYGAMDGAMRFVKGDAIAAIAIVVVNLVGGLVVGIAMKGMTAGDAAHTYSLLSIGGGLVAQIPSLLVAVASGLLVTRVASAGDRPLGDDLGGQLASSPRVLGGVAILLALLSVMPGLPVGPFLVLAAIAAAGALLAGRSRRTSAILDEDHADASRGPRLGLRLSPQLHITLAAKPAELHAVLATARADASARSGVPVPPLAVAEDAALGATEVALAIMASGAGPGAATGTPVSWLALAGPPLHALRELLPDAIAALAGELLGVDRTAQLVERAAVHAPVLVREVVPRVIALPMLADVLRRLVREEVPIDDLAAVLEAIALAPAPAGGFTAQAVPALVEHLRGQLRRQISARWAPRGQIAVYTVDGMIEDALRTAIDQRDGGSVLALEPAIARDIVDAVKGKLAGKPGVLLVSGDVRRHLRGLLEPELPAVAILAAHELAPGTSVTTAGRIDVG